MYDAILDGHIIKNVDGKTVIKTVDGGTWHEFEGIVPPSLASAVAEAYRAGHETGMKAGRTARAHELARALAAE